MALDADHRGLDLGMARGLAVFRGLALGWAWIGLGLEHEHLRRPLLAIAALAVATSFTLALVVVTVRSGDVLRPAVVGGELALGVGILVVDGVVYDALRQQSLPWAWPAAGIIAAAIVGGVRWGAAASVLIGGASFVGESMLRSDLHWETSTASKSALWLLAAVAAGAVARRLREADEETSLARSRLEVARVLHDGVLQTLAAINRRSTDEELRALATRQERELRAYVAAQHRNGPPLRTALEQIVEASQRRDDLTVELVVAEDLPDIDEAALLAMRGAVGEALTNAAKHSGQREVTVYVGPQPETGEVFCCVRDNGAGFDPERVQSGLGLQHSIRDRVEEIGGRVEIVTTPGRGTEVRLWLN